MKLQSVLVRSAVGDVTFACCTADEFENGVLMITEAVTERTKRVFQRGEWRSATVFDIRGYPEFELTADERDTP